MSRLCCDVYLWNWQLRRSPNICTEAWKEVKKERGSKKTTYSGASVTNSVFLKFVTSISRCCQCQDCIVDDGMIMNMEQFMK
jgi:hypothetical protein